MSEEERKRLSEQYDQMAEKFQKEKDEYVIIYLSIDIPIEEPRYLMFE